MNGFFMAKEKTGWAINRLEEACRRDPHVSWWDFQWEFTKFVNSGLSVVPDVNLVTNIGFGADATHTFDSLGFAATATAELELPVRHPPFMMRNRTTGIMPDKKNWWTR